MTPDCDVFSLFEVPVESRVAYAVALNPHVELGGLIWVVLTLRDGIGRRNARIYGEVMSRLIECFEAEDNASCQIDERAPAWYRALKALH